MINQNMNGGVKYGAVHNPLQWFNFYMRQNTFGQDSRRVTDERAKVNLVNRESSCILFMISGLFNPINEFNADDDIR